MEKMNHNIETQLEITCSFSEETYVVIAESLIANLASITRTVRKIDNDKALIKWAYGLNKTDGFAFSEVCQVIGISEEKTREMLRQSLKANIASAKLQNKSVVQLQNRLDLVEELARK